MPGVLQAKVASKPEPAKVEEPEAAPEAAPEAEKPAAASVEVDAAALKKSTVVQLKKKLKDLGLDTTGKKDVLIKRLVVALSAPPAAEEVNPNQMNEEMRTVVCAG